jgi:cytochrome bd-type quinol oxidase subunit 2
MAYQRRTEKRTRKTFRNFAKFFSIGMGLIYLGFGIFIIFSDPNQINLDQTFKTILGGILILYGCLRFIRAYHQHTKEKQQKYEE